MAEGFIPSHRVTTIFESMGNASIAVAGMDIVINTPENVNVSRIFMVMTSILVWIVVCVPVPRGMHGLTAH